MSDEKALKFLSTFQGSSSVEFSKKFGKSDFHATDLLAKMLEFNPYFRPTAEECLQHPFFDGVFEDQHLHENDKLKPFTFEFDERSPSLETLGTLFER